MLLLRYRFWSLISATGVQLEIGWNLHFNILCHLEFVNPQLSIEICWIFTFTCYTNKLQFYCLLTVLFRRLCSSVLPSSVCFTIHWSLCIYKLECYTIMDTSITIVLSVVTRILSQYCLAGYCHFNNKRQYCHLNILVGITNITAS
jgi:hypothetical protein